MKYLLGTISLIYSILVIINPTLNKSSIIFASIFYVAYLIMDNSDENMKVIRTWLENQQNPVKEEEENGL